MSKPRRPKSRFPHVFSVYRAKDGWRWRLFARNGRVIADSGEAYKRKAAAIKGCEAIQDIHGSAIFVEGEELE
jgi:uncharacterized protein YegP (UPF0339 family)